MDPKQFWLETNVRLKPQEIKVEMLETLVNERGEVKKTYLPKILLWASLKHCYHLFKKNCLWFLPQKCHISQVIAHPSQSLECKRGRQKVRKIFSDDFFENRLLDFLLSTFCIPLLWRSSSSSSQHPPPTSPSPRSPLRNVVDTGTGAPPRGQEETSLFGVLSESPLLGRTELLNMCGSLDFLLYSHFEAGILLFPP